jgi:hypothetical protein
MLVLIFLSNRYPALLTMRVEYVHCEQAACQIALLCPLAARHAAAIGQPLSDVLGVVDGPTSTGTDLFL